MKLLRGAPFIVAAIMPTALMMSSCTHDHAKDMAAVDTLRYEAEALFAEKGPILKQISSMILLSTR